MRRRPVALFVGALSLVMVSCAQPARWRPADPRDLSFDGEHPPQVQVRTATYSVLMPHPILRGDSLIAKYGKGQAVRLSDIVELQEYETKKEGLETGEVIAVTVLGAMALLVLAGVLICATDDYLC